MVLLAMVEKSGVILTRFSAASVNLKLNLLDLEMTKIKIAFLAAVLLFGASATYVWARWQPCSTVRECYWSWKAFTSNAKADQRTDRFSLAQFFAASERSAAFPIPSRKEFGLLFFDFSGRRHIKLTLSGSDLLSPFLTHDGKELLFVRHPYDRVGRDLISCSTSDFSCKTIFKSEGSILSPVRMADGRIIFGGSPATTGTSGRTVYLRYDLWLLDQSGKATQLTSMKLYEIYAISVTKQAIYFSTFGWPPKSVIPRPSPVAKQQSDIFKLAFDPLTGAIEKPDKPLVPQFLKDGYARSSAVSHDGSLAAVLRTPQSQGTYHFSLAIEAVSGTPSYANPPSQIGFSRPVMIGDTAYVNDIRENGYRIMVGRLGTVALELKAEVTDDLINSIEWTNLSLAP